MSSSDAKRNNKDSRKKTNDKKHKKDKKKKNKKASRRSESASPTRDTDAEGNGSATTATGVTETKSDSRPAAALTDDARDFFARLKQQESSKEAVGTIHASGVKASSSATPLSSTDQWECSKAGCGHKNSKYASACNKCGAMKRMSEWR